MRIIETQIPDPVFQKARELAMRENVSVEQIITLAVTQTIAVWSNGTSLPAQPEASTEYQTDNCAPYQGRRAGREKFLEAINGMLAAKAEAQERALAGCAH